MRLAERALLLMAAKDRLLGMIFKTSKIKVCSYTHKRVDSQQILRNLLLEA